VQSQCSQPAKQTGSIRIKDLVFRAKEIFLREKAKKKVEGKEKTIRAKRGIDCSSKMESDNKIPIWGELEINDRSDHLILSTKITYLGVKQHFDRHLRYQQLKWHQLRRRQG
jgi:hypothetical protein